MTAGTSILLITAENQVTTGITRLLRSINDVSLRLASCLPSEVNEYDLGQLSLILLDNELPEEETNATLETLTQAPEFPPILVLSEPNPESMQRMVDSLKAGADDFLPRPSENLQMDPDVLAACLAEKITAFTQEKPQANPELVTELDGKRIKEASAKVKIIALGLGTGGTKAILNIIPQLPKRPRVACLVVLQAPPPFLAPLANVLAQESPIEVFLARHHLEIVPGRFILAASAMQMGVIKCDEEYLVELTISDTISGQLPSIDYLFRTIADTYGKNSLCVLMTGNGSDGVSGVRLLKSRGALVLGQHPTTNTAPERVIQALEIGMISELIPLPRLARRIREIVNLSMPKSPAKSKASAPKTKPK